MKFRAFEGPDEATQRLQDTLAWDFSHEYVLTDTGMHIRHLNGSFLCKDEGGGLHETTPWGGDGPCPHCIKLVPDYVKWCEPQETQNHYNSWSVREVCDLFGIELHVTNDRSEISEMGATAPGATMVSWDPPVLYVGHTQGTMTRPHMAGALHEITHLLTSPYGYTSEVGCGHYAVQYALAKCMDDSQYLCQSTLDMQGTRDPVFGGIMQARAWALGLLDSGRNLNFERFGV